MKVDEALTRRVAELARLELSPGEVTTFTAQLGSILKYVDELSALDVAGIEPLSQPFASETAFRDDRAVPWAPAENGEPRVLSCAPEVEDGGFKVPQVVG